MSTCSHAKLTPVVRSFSKIGDFSFMEDGSATKNALKKTQQLLILRTFTRMESALITLKAKKTVQTNFQKTLSFDEI